MADTTFRDLLPPTKAVDLLDGTFAMSVAATAPAPGTDTTFRNIFPPLKAVDLGDGTYAVAVEVI